MRRVVILGGGPAGCATALSLLAAGLDPAELSLVDAGRRAYERIGQSIPPETRRVLGELGLLDTFLAQGHEPSRGSASSWGHDELGYNDFVFGPYGHGWHIDRRRFDVWLLAEVAARGVVVEQRANVDAAFVVDATGMRSHYARRMGARRREHDRLVCVSVCFGLPEGAVFARQTLLEAVEYGWWYCARLPDQKIGVALATSRALFREHRFDQPRAWLRALVGTRHVVGPLSVCEPEPGSLSICTVSSSILDRVVGDHWLAVGDAASTWDPISAQGIFKALSDGLTVGRPIAEFLRGHRGALADHQQHVERSFDEYTRQRAFYYAQEQRWPDAAFWRERAVKS